MNLFPRRLGWRRAALVTGFLALRLAPGALAAESVENLWDLYQKGALLRVVEAGESALAEAPEAVELNLVVGRALADLNLWDRAIPRLERGSAGDPAGTWRKAWALVFLGRAHFALGRESDARRCLSEAVTLNATRNATADARGLQRLFGFTTEYDGASRRESPNFIFVFSTELKGMDEERFVKAHEEAFAAISGVFGSRVPQKIRFFVWSSNEDAARAGVRSLGFARPEYALIHSRANQTVGHEMTHVISHYGFSPRSKTGLINEGTAVFFDQNAGNRTSRAAAAARRHKEPVQVESMWLEWDRWPEAVRYPVAGAWVGRLMARGGQPMFFELLRDQTLDRARALYGTNLAAWIQEFEAELRPASTPPPASEPSPVGEEEGDLPEPKLL